MALLFARSALLIKLSMLGLLLSSTSFTSHALAEEAEFESLFDGQYLNGWDGDPDFWSVEDGAITGQTTPDKLAKKNTFLIWKGGEPSDFELRFQFRIEGGNSGVQYRSKEVDQWTLSGYQADFDDANQWTGSLYEERGRGILATRGNKVKVTSEGKKESGGETTAEETILASMKPDNGWNQYRIVARGNHLQHFVNGNLTIDVVDEHEARRSMAGVIGLQVHKGPPMKVQFKDIKLKQFTSKAAAAAKTDDRKKIVFVAGKPSHRPREHEHNAGCLLLAKHLQAAMPDYQIDVHRNGWPADPEEAFADADAVVIYCDGGPRHVVLPHLGPFNDVMNRGTGLVCVHYGVEVPKGPGGAAMLKWMGGYFEPDWSVNPHWKASFESLPDHPITRGVKPFAIQDEWYFHMRFRDDMQGVTPILTAVAPDSTMARPDGAHSGNPHVRRAVAAKEPQHVAWASERKNGGRGFGFTGAHFHDNWANDDFRRVVLNAIVWSAHGEIPDGGVDSTTPTEEDLQANLDEKPAKKKKKPKKEPVGAK